MSLRVRALLVVALAGLGWAGAPAKAGLITVNSVSAIDTTTQGNWLTYNNNSSPTSVVSYVYGNAGYVLPEFWNNNTDAVALPSFISGYSYGSGTALYKYTYANNSTDLLAPAKPPSGDTLGERSEGLAYNNSGVAAEIDFTVDQNAHFLVSVYSVDRSNQSRASFIMLDPSEYQPNVANWTTPYAVEATDNPPTDEITYGVPVVTAPTTGLQNGNWVTFDVTVSGLGPDQTITLPILDYRQYGPNALIQAVTFEAAPEPASLGLTAIAALSLLARRRK